MELLLVLRNKNILDKIKNSIDGIIVGQKFCSGFDYDDNDLRQLSEYCKKNQLSFNVMIENFVSEDQLDELESYFSFINSLNINNIYFHDLGIIEISKKYNLSDALIYDGQTVLANSLDAKFYLSQGLKSVVISRELTLEEISKIVDGLKNEVSMQVFGHLRMSYSKRKFLTNYFKEINKEYDYLNSKSLFLIEEQRDYKMPILEDVSGTKIYTDYIFVMEEELKRLSNNLKAGIIESLFIDDETLIRVCDDYRKIINGENVLIDYIDNKSKAYLYTRTNITKDE